MSKVVGKIFNSIDELDEDLQNMKYPDGTKDNPARTCKDIKIAHPEFKDGKQYEELLLQLDLLLNNLTYLCFRVFWPSGHNFEHIVLKFCICCHCPAP